MLDVQLPRSAVDVNVVPDKRTVMMQCEQEVVHALEQVCVLCVLCVCVCVLCCVRVCFMCVREKASAVHAEEQLYVS